MGSEPFHKSEAELPEGAVPDPSVDKPSLRLRAALRPLFAGTGGIDSWISDDMNPRVAERLLRVDEDPLSRSQLNQLLLLAQEVGLSPDCFAYYWLSAPEHPYDTTLIGSYDSKWTSRGSNEIVSLDHLR